jgi:hypothetical protein
MKKRGNIFISTLFVVLITLVGISLLTFTIIHTRIVRARTAKLVETDAIYQDLVRYLHRFRETLFNEAIADFAAPESDYFNSTYFPDVALDRSRFITHSFQCEDIPQPYFKKTRVTAVCAISSTSVCRNNYRIHAEAAIDLLAGEIPLTMIPFFLNTGKETTPGPVDSGTFLTENHIVNKSDKNVMVDDIAVKWDIAAFLIDALKITGSKAGWREIREKFGFPPSDQPIPRGLYLVVEEGAVESVFIQGNMARMIFAVEGDIQLIRFVQDAATYELRYKPGENYFASWDYSLAPDALFKEKIMVNGSVGSIEQEGEQAFTPAADITLQVSGKAVIRTSLETAAGHLAYREVQLSNLKLVCSKNGLESPLDPGKPEPEVVVDTEGMEGEDEAELNLSIMVDGRFSNNTSRVKLSGSLYCTGIENKGDLEIHTKDAAVSANNPFSTVDFKYIHGFYLNFIEEVYDDGEN